ncbi:undecaprenyl-phosphate 4-deoxy-4-formamido-L-arabinose transferase [Daejeonella rubra]|uniref:Undecaprenyl-phosphate 4-deoxy-4-formamido-L-arabinose transferase n=1 Tax=Daejeonella rubra TaxID=990371 RepID=A0A1G9WX67_9SPHI|nr:glycosyltransferase [Daejeonella rubra]SDM89174.1 undecaprenyl-phosphate 4-deoxy-4-formamido-L-arabinose transferase [Daejeonella rubra]
MKVSLASPVYNESEKITEFVHRAVQSLKNISENIELVLVDDCSSDDTVDKVKSLLKQYPFIKLIRLTKNSGQHIATSIALQHTSGDLIFMMDSDLQINPESMKDMFDFSNLKESWDIISANRLTRSSSLRRQVGSKIISFLLQRIGKNKFKDIGSTFKLIKRKALDKMLANDILIQNLPILIMNLNFKIIEFPIDYNQIQNRKSHYRVTDLLSVITLALLNFSTGGSTLIILIITGVLFFFIGSTTIVGLILWGIINVSELPTNMLLFSTMLAIIGLQLILLSMVVFKLERLNKNLDFRKAINQRIEYEND